MEADTTNLPPMSNLLRQAVRRVLSSKRLEGVTVGITSYNVIIGRQGTIEMLSATVSQPCAQSTCSLHWGLLEISVAHALGPKALVECRSLGHGRWGQQRAEGAICARRDEPFIIVEGEEIENG